MEDNYIDTEKACENSKRQFRRFMRKIVVILAAIFLALLLLVADRYNWFGPLPTPLHSIAKYVRYNLSYIKTGLLILLFILSWIALNMGINRYEKRHREEIERNVTESVPIPLEVFLNDWNSVPANCRSDSFLKRPLFGYKYVFLSGVYVLAEHDEAGQRLVPIFVGSSFVGACCSRAYARLSNSPETLSVADGNVYVIFFPCSKEEAADVKTSITQRLAEAYTYAMADSEHFDSSHPSRSGIPRYERCHKHSSK